MTNLTKHIADGPYVVMGDSIFEATESYIICESTPESDVNQLCEVMNFPAKVLEVLRERYKASVARHGNEELGSYRSSPNIEAHTILTIAESLGFSREDVTR